MNLYGLRIIESRHMCDKRWKFPEDRFAEWGPEDESYCRLAGYGHEVEVPWPNAYRVGDTIHMHPLLAEQFRKKLAEATDGGIRRLPPLKT